MFVFKIILHFKSKCFLARNMKETEEHSLLCIVVYNIQIFFSLSIWMPTGTCLYGNQSEKYKRKTAGYLPHCAGVVLVYMTTKVRNMKETLQAICYIVLPWYLSFWQLLPKPNRDKSPAIRATRKENMADIA